MLVCLCHDDIIVFVFIKLTVKAPRVFNKPAD